MAPDKTILKLLLIILFSFIIILNTISLLPAFQGVAQLEVEKPGDLETYTDRNQNTETIKQKETARLDSCLSSCLMDLDLDYFNLVENTAPSESLCGDTASKRGNHQKVVAFSFYGDMKHGYYQGITDNLDLMQELYPGWVFRLYIDSAKMQNQTRLELCSVACNSNRFDLCPVNHLPQFGDLSQVFGMTWRFLPLCDPTVDVMVARDLDSRLTQREQAAVIEWLESGLAFHSMRDNLHHGVEILGGMWGARLDSGHREKLGGALQKLLKDAATHGWNKGLDQSLLTKWIWPQVKKDVMEHDSYLCKRFKSEHWRPWPTKRVSGPYNFVGAAGPMEIKTACPEECRPLEHKDWTMC